MPKVTPSAADGDAAMDLPAEPQIFPNVIAAMGNTPLVRLNAVTRGIRTPVVAKLEMLNPGGSVKDRIGIRMIEEAERRGWLKPGGTIVEPTSGNTGVGLAMAAAVKGYHCIFVMPDKVAPEKVALLRAYGAEVVTTPTAVERDSPESYYSVADRLTREVPNAFQPNQYFNPMNPRAHYEATGPEIWRQTAGRITHFVAGVGTGGTISGVARYLKEQNPEINVIGVDPEGSIYTSENIHTYKVEGVGEDFWPDTYDRTICDEIIEVSDKESFEMTRRLAREEGLLVGGSCGMAVVAALKVARNAGPDDVVVVLLPDGGRGYLSKIFNDNWMARYGFMRTGGDEATVADVLAGKSGQLPELVHVHPTETVRDAIDYMREYGVSQLPVLKAEPPVMTGEVAGSIAEKDLMDALFSGQANLHDTVERHMTEPLPMIGGGQPVSEAVALLEKADAALVLIDGKPKGVITRQDLLTYLR